MKIKQNKLMNYCAIPAGVLASAASVSGQTVIFYDIGDSTPFSVGVSTSSNSLYGLAYEAIYLINYSGNFGSWRRSGVFFESTPFTYGDTVSADSSIRIGSRTYSLSTGVTLGVGFNNGATNGDQNYANLDFDGDGTYDAVGQFEFELIGEDFDFRLLAVAFSGTAFYKEPSNLYGVGGGGAYSISDGAAAITAASVPEPSSVALLALGATGLLMRRQRKAA